MRPTVVADTGPLNYLVLVGQIDVLRSMYGEVIIPDVVAAELCHHRAPRLVRAWASAPPPWIVVRGQPAGADSPLLLGLDPGESAAIALALAIGAGLLLADDRAARAAARAHGLGTVGTIGILDRAARDGLLHLPAVVEALRATNFRYPPAVLDAVIAEDVVRRDTDPGGHQ